mgnify:CR=1 FL=1
MPNTGLLYGIQTLRQIITQFGAVLPEVEIEDMPDFSFNATLCTISI